MKRCKNLILAAIMSVTIGMQSVVPVQAADVSPMSTDVWVCVDCGKPVSVSEVWRIEKITKKRKCDIKEHQSVGCEICDIDYVVETWISCSGCPKSAIQSERKAFKEDQHLTFA